MNLLKEFLLDNRCSYLSGKKQTTQYKIIDNISFSQCQELVERGYRRFGKTFFRPVCSGCDECKSIKIDVDNFKFSKSQRRVLKKAQAFKTYMQTPTMSQDHLDLFEKYHLYMKDKKGWDHSKTNPQNYYSSFVDGHLNFGHEILYFDEEKLIGVDLIDILEDGISSIYFYWDPDYLKYSLGKLSLLIQIKLAQSNHKKWIYLGYYVKDCPSLSYKSEYKPYLTLDSRPTENDDYMWN